MPAVTITSGDTTSQNLTISPTTPLPVGRSSIVTWIVTGGAGITISAITPYDDSTDIFDPEHEPGPVGGQSKNWQGTVSSTIAIDTEERYKILWYVDGSPNNIYTFDPRLTVSAGNK